MQFYAKDIMSDSLITVRPEMTSEEVTELFLVNKITGAPVVDANGVLVGVVSIFDIMDTMHGISGGRTMETYHTELFPQEILDLRMGETGFHIEELQGFVSDYMKRHVYTAYPDMPVEELARIMYENRIHRVIVLKPNEQKPIGVVTTFDLLKLVAEAPSTAEISTTKEEFRKREEERRESAKRGEPFVYREDRF